MSDSNSTQLTPFAELFHFIDSTVIGVIQSGTANVITLITPLIAAGFGIYMMLILSSYWRGSNDDHITDFLLRMMSWVVVIFLGLNVNNYLEYVVPFVNGLGEDLAKVVVVNGSGEHYDSAAALDSMFNNFVQAILNIWKDAPFPTSIVVGFMCVFLMLVGGIFMVIAVGYILLAKLALGILVAIGPIFIAAALFPATRKLFESWVAQCLNYAFLTMLFSFASQLQVNMMVKMIPKVYEVSAIFMFEICCIALIFVSLNLPSLASALAGGVGISAMVGRVGQAISGMSKMAKLMKLLGGGKGSNHKQQPEQK